MVSSLSGRAGLVKLGRWAFKGNICSMPLMIFVISHLSRLPCDLKQGMQGDELRKSFPEGTLKLIVENEACLFAGVFWLIFQLGRGAVWILNGNGAGKQHSPRIYKMYVSRNTFTIFFDTSDKGLCWLAKCSRSVKDPNMPVTV